MRQEDLHNRNHSSQEAQVGHANFADQKQPLRCANCDIDILWSPIVVQEKTYCCTGCAAGGPCCCDYSLYRSITISGVIHYGPDEEASTESSHRETS